ncbi:MAG: hypothetical protein HPPSJP_5250 [Candidatus Hepatoplasma scabrum]|nr:MAG: hypothetical protein HPPSJP_5250 [Candidatus Hepatoplasma sp.]
MTNEELIFIKNNNYDYYLRIITKIEDEYQKSKKIKLANIFSAFFYYLGYLILITLFQNAAALSFAKKGQFRKAALYALLGLNIFFFLYLGESKKWKKHYNQKIKKINLTQEIQEKIKNQEFLKGLTEDKLELIKKEKLFNTNPPKDKIKLGLVYGSSVRAKNLFKDIGANIVNVSGGKMQSYFYLLNDAREDAIEQMIKNAILTYGELDNKEIHNIRLSTSQIANGASEILVYGTVVKNKNS